MHWNHRIVDRSKANAGEPWFEVREVFYEKDGSVTGHTTACLGDEDPEQIIALLQRMIDDIRRNPTIVKEQA